MNQIVIYPAGNGPAVQFAAKYLAQRGLTIAREPGGDISHLLLCAPSFENDGRIRGGGILEHLLADLPEDITVIGGNLNHSALGDYKTMDLLTDGQYLARNAAITAECAIRVAEARLPVVLEGCPVLILGWGRIGKCLAARLKCAGARVSVAARKESDRNILRALGYGAEDPAQLRHTLVGFRIIFNTVPAPVLDEDQLHHCRRDCLCIELASKPGLMGKDVIQALGLPGKLAPESSGALMGQTIIRRIAEQEAVKK